MEFSADKEFYGTYLEARKALINAGWREGTSKRDQRMISVLYTKDGYGIYLIYGCEEDIRDEML